MNVYLKILSSMLCVSLYHKDMALIFLAESVKTYTTCKDSRYVF